MPQLWNHVRRAVDAREGPFILTGSAVPADDATRHTGAGRFSWIRMRPMTLFELGRSTGDVSLGKLLDGEKMSVSAPEISISELAEITSIGGWPGLLRSSAANAQRVLRGYLDSVARTDIRRVDGVTRDPQKVRSVLRSLARNVATEVSIATIAAGAGGADGPVARPPRARTSSRSIASWCSRSNRHGLRGFDRDRGCARRRSGTSVTRASP